MPLNQKMLLASAISCAVGITTTSAVAQMLEEVVVTATKKAEGLQDVPISISVMQGERMAEMGLQNLEDLTVYMPNVFVAEGPANTNIFIRGVGSGSNFGFEQSVGTFIDGVYFGRGRSARNRFLDVERVEVLKGPQSTLFGKNTIAGAMNITTVAPTDEFDAYLEASYRTELEGTRFEGMISGPISDTVRGRLAAAKYDDEGYVENRAQGGDDSPQQDNWGVRARLDWDATENLTFALKAESAEFKVDGRMTVISEANPFATAMYQTYGDPSFVPGFNYDQWTLGVDEEGIWDDTETRLIQLTTDYALGESTLRSITAYTEYKFENELSADLSPLRFIDRGRVEEHDQFSQEFLWTSSFGDRIDYLAGAYYQYENLKNDRHTPVLFSALPPIELGIFSQLGLDLPSGALDGDIPSSFKQDTETWSVFTDVTYHLTDEVRLIAGIRYSQDGKDVVKDADVPNIPGVVPDAFYEAIYSGFGFATVHSYELSRDENHTTGHVVAQWDATDDAMMYLSWSNGYKAGGFDEDNAVGNLEFAEYGDETVDSWEVGGKFQLMDGRGRLNAAYFYSKYDNLQVSAFDGTASYFVRNAAKAEVQGIEGDVQFAITDELSIESSFAWLDASYDSFPDAPCNEAQLLELEAETGSRVGCTQDLSGETLQYAPEYSFNFGFYYDTQITSKLALAISADYLWTDEFYIETDLDENLVQSSYDKINARIALSDIDQRWTIAVLGKNLTDEQTFPSGGEVPLAELGFSGTYFRHIDPPRTFEFSLRYRFQ
ncbi:MAG: TonB-dependent receptor [Pseudomonadota bacterium]